MVNAKTRFYARLNSIVMFVLLTTLVAVAMWLTNKHNAVYDWTASGRHTLSDASRDLLKQMSDPIEVTSYAREIPPLRDSIRKFVNRYQRHKEDIKLHFVNPDAVPDKVRELGIQVDGEIVIRYQDRTEHVRADNEQVFTNALQRLARNQENWMAFIEGHGERSALGQANFDLGEWVAQLTNQGFRTQPINLGDIQAIPDNTRILVIAGPRVDYLAGEVALIVNYIKQGGNLLWLLDPEPLFGLESLMEELDIALYEGAIIDYAGQLIGINDPTIALVTKNLYPPHIITQQFEFTTLFPHAGAIAINESETWDIKPIITTGDHTWVETQKLEGAVEYNEDEDKIGPLNIGVTLEREREQEEGDELVTIQQRIAVIADGDFLSNTYLANSGNSELGTRIVNWLSSDDEFIAIPPKVAGDTQLDMSNTLLGTIGIFFMFILPIGLVVLGITIGLRRKTK